MMRVRVWGGLGNQMFIYAFAKALAKKGYDVVLDVQFYKFDRFKNSNQNELQAMANRRLEISSFDLKIPFSNYSSACTSLSKTNIFHKAIGKLTRSVDNLVNFKNLVKEDQNFVQKWEKQNFPKNALFQGYFQNVLFFDNLRNDLIQDFHLKSDLSMKNLKLKRMIEDTPNSCFIHIRLGDYLSSENWMFAKLGKTYYSSSIRLIKNKIKNPRFFIFSNDIKWCKNNFLQLLDEETERDCTFYFVENNNEGNAVEELELMKACKHGIIANSTFSWWGAYLIENKNKICTIPSIFMYYDYSVKKYLPHSEKENWHIIDIFWGNKKE